MSERKVLNKYYPPDFDPSKIPKLRLPRNRQYSIRIMAPFNMRCNTCGEYIYKGKKFNSRKETVEDEDYLGLKIFRFYIKCPRCVAEIAFKTDPENTDYSLEDGATRNFEANRTAEMLAQQELKEKEDEERNNPMKVLENRTKASQREMEMLETLEDLKELNSRHARVDHESMIDVYRAYEEQLKKLQEEEDENFIKSVFGRDGGESIKRLQEDDDEEEDHQVKLVKTSNPTDVLTQGSIERNTSKSINKVATKRPANPWQRSVGSLSTKTTLGVVVKKKKTTVNESEPKKGKDDLNSDVNQPNQMSKQMVNSHNESKKSEENSTKSNASTALSLLGNYSDSEDSNHSDS